MVWSLSGGYVDFALGIKAVSITLGWRGGVSPVGRGPGSGCLVDQMNEVALFVTSVNTNRGYVHIIYGLCFKKRR